MMCVLPHTDRCPQTYHVHETNRKRDTLQNPDYSSSIWPHAPCCHMRTERTVMPRSSPSAHVGSHSSAASQNVHCAFLASSIQGLPPTWSLEEDGVSIIHLA